MVCKANKSFPLPSSFWSECFYRDNRKLARAATHTQGVSFLLSYPQTCRKACLPGDSKSSQINGEEDEPSQVDFGSEKLKTGKPVQIHGSFLSHTVDCPGQQLSHVTLMDTSS